MAKRLVIVLVLLIIFLFYIIGKLVYLSVFKVNTYEKNVLKQQKYLNSEINYRRGDILDTHGNVLATSRKLYQVILEPKNIIGQRSKKNGVEVPTENEKSVTKALKKYLGVSNQDIAKALKNKDSYYYTGLCGKLTESQVSGLKAFLKTENGKKLNGIRLDESYQRVYPNKTLACHTIGFLTNGSESGVGGIEQYYNNSLKGTNGRRYTYLNEKMEYDTSIDEPVNGKTVVSTIDVNIQKITEKYLKKFEDTYGSLNSSAIVLNPNNGEILAIANSNIYDPADPSNLNALLQKYSRKQIKAMKKKEKAQALVNIWNNYAVTNTFEPGSTFKPFTVAMSLESGTVSGNEYFHCKGYKKVGNTKIKCSHVHGTIPLSTALAKSCNVAMMEMSAKLGRQAFVKYQKSYGFASKTGIDLPGEASASNVLHDESMTSVDLATSSFGQNFQCTMIQLVSGFASLINGGNYYQPHIVNKILDSDGNVEKTIGSTLVRKTVSESTSEKLRQYMRETVTSGTGRIANISEYKIAGKTGTAEKYPRGTNKRLVSFIGFAPYDNPELVVYVTIDEIQKGSQSNTGLAVEISKNILKDSLEYLGVKADKKQK